MNIKKEFKKWIKEQCYDYTDWSDLIEGDHEISFYIQQAFEEGYKSRDKEIEELKLENKKLRDALEAIDRLDEVSVYDQATKSICIAQEALKDSE